LESLLRAATTGEFNRLYEITNKTTDRFIEQQATFCLDTFRDLSKSNKDEANNLLIFLDAGADKILRKIKDMEDYRIAVATIKTPDEKIAADVSNRKSQDFEAAQQAPAPKRSDRKEDPLRDYYEKEAMSPLKIKEHSPTPVRREPSYQTIVEEGRGSEYEQGAAGENK
jgi:hypothetical protein